MPYNYTNRISVHMLKYLLPLALVLVSSLYSQEIHVFWYKALQNNYALTDSPGPNIPANAIVHEGKMVTCNHTPGLGFNGSGFSCGSNTWDDQGWCGFLYSANVNDEAFSGRVDSAFIRGEYTEPNSILFSTPLNNGGPINIRCGVVDVSFSVDSVWNGGDSLPDDAVYPDMDPSNTLDYSLPLVDSTVDTIAFIAEEGRFQGQGPSLDSQFVKVDVTKQVKWIGQHHNGKYGIALLSPVGQGSTGKFSLWADETCNSDFSYYINPWTKDGNTTHLLVYGDLTDSISTERAPQQRRIGLTATIAPNPFNPSTKIAVSQKADVEIYDVQGKLVDRLAAQSSQPLEWNASRLPGGVYFCRAKAGGKMLIGKMVYLP